MWDLSKKLVKHNTLIPTELQSCKFKYSFLTIVPRKVFELFSKFIFFWSLNFLVSSHAMFSPTRLCSPQRFAWRWRLTCRKPLSGKWNFSGFAQSLLRLYSSVCMSSITLRHRLTYRAENLNIASLKGSPGSFLTVFEIFLVLVSKIF